MGANLAKSPLVAVYYAAILYFAGLFLPLSDMYRHIMTSFRAEIPLTGYLMLMAYGLLIAAVAAMVFASAEKTGIPRLGLMAVSFLGLQWVTPLLRQLALGEVSGVMTQADTLWRMAQGAVCTLLTLVLCMLLYGGAPQENKGAKSKIKILQLVIFLLVLPVIYAVLYFVLGYFLGWRNDAVRIYYQGGGNAGFFHMLIDMFLEGPEYAGFALLRGLFSALFGLPLLLLLTRKKVIFIVANALLSLSGALLFLLPNPTIPADSALPLFLAEGAVQLVYGGLSGFMLHLCLAPVQQPQPAQKPQAQAQQRPSAPAAARR